MYKMMIAAIMMLAWPGSSPAQDSVLISFSVEPDAGGQVLIQWKMSPGPDTLPFIVERSRDTIRWETIAMVPARLTHLYSTIAEWPGETVFYYRVRQSVPAGQGVVSSTKWVRAVKSGHVYLWPNPARDLLHIKTTFTGGTMEIMDGEGKMVMRMVITNHLTDIPVSKLPKGIYFLQIRRNKEMFTERFVRE